MSLEATTTPRSPRAHNSLALRSDGSLVAWGDKTYGESNAPTSGYYLAVPAGSGFNSGFRPAMLTRTSW